MNSAALTESEFVDARLLEAVPSVFDGDHEGYLAWRRLAARQLQVDPRNVLVVGSAARGFSIKSGKAFAAESDIDVAVISAVHFDSAWHYLRTVRVGTIKCTADQREHIRDYAAGYVYRGCIARTPALAVRPLLAARLREAWSRSARWRPRGELPALPRHRSASHVPGVLTPSFSPELEVIPWLRDI